MNILKLFRAAVCTHKNDNLRFIGTGVVGTFDGLEKTNYFYKCKCGAELCFDNPIDCCGCSHLVTDEGGTSCNLHFNDKICLTQNRKYFSTRIYK